jgi:hypothetical protein
MKKILILIPALALALGSGCGEKAAEPSGHHHHHEAPHGGTVVALDHEIINVEFVLDAAAGKLTAYMLGGHLDGFVRLGVESFEVAAEVNGQPQPLLFKAVANAATGEKVGNTSQFEAQADWLKTAKAFKGTIRKLDVRGKTFQGVAFDFPEKH